MCGFGSDEANIIQTDEIKSKRISNKSHIQADTLNKNVEMGVMN